ncbi:hypothetical protein [Psychroserpens sp.]|uniref:hypothetical protein n=1 Tax=Psychroserpens sp. TaxID=2020870 RepID=UPI002B2729B3|nr:hypothetical protein [Psychroserpens sp.]
MKKLQFTLAILLSLFLQSNLQAQELINSQALVESNTGLILTFDRSDKTIQGSPYIYEEFSPARVSADQDKIFNLRYNAVSDEIEVQTDKSTIQAINKNIKGVTITFLKDDKTYQAINYIDSDGSAKRGYFIYLTNTNDSNPLLLKESIKFLERQPAKSSYQEAKPAEFKRQDDKYYIMLKNETAVELPSKKKEIANLFPEHSKDILDFIKSNSIKTSKQEDLIQLARYINTF